MSTTISGTNVKSGKLSVLGQLEQRILWLSTAMIDHANRVRPNRNGLKVADTRRPAHQ